MSLSSSCGGSFTGFRTPDEASNKPGAFKEPRQAVSTGSPTAPEPKPGPITDESTTDTGLSGAAILPEAEIVIPSTSSAAAGEPPQGASCFSCMAIISAS